jgi:hypothetical protein
MENDIELDEPNKALLGKWQEKISAAVKRNENWEKKLEQFRQYQMGKQPNKDKPVRTNLIYSTIATILPLIYAKNPEISITPSRTVTKDIIEATKKFASTAEIVLEQKVIKEPKLKEQAKANVRSTMVTALGWLKMVYQKEMGKDPLVEHRIQDAQDNLKRIERLIEVSDDSTRAEHEMAKAELTIEINQLQTSDAEIELYKGFVIDRIKSEDMFILDESIEEFHQYPDAEAIAHRVWFTVDKFEEVFGRKPEATATKYKQRAAQEHSTTEKDKNQNVEYVAVFEVWGRSSNTVYTLCLGEQIWCREPYQPSCTSKRWYPFFALAYNVVEGRWLPMSDVELLIELQDEYENTRQAYTDHRQDSLPVRFARSNGNLTEADLMRIQNRKARDIIAIEGNPTAPLTNDIGQLPSIPIDPAVYDVSQIRNDMDMMSGLSDASRGNLIQPKTATEAEIMEQKMSSRVDERRDTTEDHLTEIFTSALEILLDELTEEDVKAIAGEDATWPQMTKEEIFSMVNVGVRAGSTTKPNKMRERETWVQLLPQIEKTMQTVSQLRESGQVDMANAAMELLRETIGRFDERIDLDTFIPPVDREDELTKALEMLQEMRTKLEQMEAEYPELKKAADANAVKREEIASREKIEIGRAIIAKLGNTDEETEANVQDQVNAVTTDLLQVADAVQQMGQQEPEQVVPQ